MNRTGRARGYQRGGLSTALVLRSARDDRSIVTPHANEKRFNEIILRRSAEKVPGKVTQEPCFVLPCRRHVHLPALGRNCGHPDVRDDDFELLQADEPRRIRFRQQQADLIKTGAAEVDFGRVGFAVRHGVVEDQCPEQFIIAACQGVVAFAADGDGPGRVQRREGGPPPRRGKRGFCTRNLAMYVVFRHGRCRSVVPHADTALHPDENGLGGNARVFPQRRADRVQRAVGHHRDRRRRSVDRVHHRLRAVLDHLALVVGDGEAIEPVAHPLAGNVRPGTDADGNVRAVSRHQIFCHHVGAVRTLAVSGRDKLDVKPRILERLHERP